MAKRVKLEHASTRCKVELDDEGHAVPTTDPYMEFEPEVNVKDEEKDEFEPEVVTKTEEEWVEAALPPWRRNRTVVDHALVEEKEVVARPSSVVEFALGVLGPMLWRLRRGELPEAGSVLIVINDCPSELAVEDPSQSVLFQNIMTRIRHKAEIVGCKVVNGWLWVRVATEKQATRCWKRLHCANVLEGQITLQCKIVKDADWPPGHLPIKGDGYAMGYRGDRK